MSQGWQSRAERPKKCFKIEKATSAPHFTPTTSLSGPVPVARCPRAAPRTRSSRWAAWRTTARSCAASSRRWGRSQPAAHSCTRAVSAKGRKKSMDNLELKSPLCLSSSQVLHYYRNYQDRCARINFPPLLQTFSRGLVSMYFECAKRGSKP